MGSSPTFESKLARSQKALISFFREASYVLEQESYGGVRKGTHSGLDGTTDDFLGGTEEGVHLRVDERREYVGRGCRRKGNDGGKGVEDRK